VIASSSACVFGARAFASSAIDSMSFSAASRIAVSEAARLLPLLRDSMAQTPFPIFECLPVDNRLITLVTIVRGQRDPAQQFCTLPDLVG
jgi:hypothetical protein